MWIPCVYRITQHSSLFALLPLSPYNTHLFLNVPSIWNVTVKFVSTNTCPSLWSVLFLFLCALSVAVGYLWTYFQGTVLLKECRLPEGGLFTWKYGNYFSPCPLSFSTSISPLAPCLSKPLLKVFALLSPNTPKEHYNCLPLSNITLKWDSKNCCLSVLDCLSLFTLPAPRFEHIYYCYLYPGSVP